MRYSGYKPVDFEDVFGETKKIFPLRREDIAPVVQTYVKPVAMNLDELAVKLVGDGGELFSYQLREQNVRRLLQFDFDESRLQKVEIGSNL